MEIKEFTLSGGRLVKLICFKEIISTNTYLKNEANNGAPEYTVVIADRQSGGRGRLGRSFVSEEKCGLYMSLLLRPVEDFDFTSLTAIIGISVNEAIFDVFGLTCGIKWVNDIIYKGRKVCGILAEGALKDNGALDYAVIGIGVNIAPPADGFDASIKDVAGALCKKYSDEIRDRLARSILERINLNLSRDKASLLKRYRDMSCVIGKRVKVITPSLTYFAAAEGIDSDFGLIVTKDDGSCDVLRYGEISVKM